MIFIYAFENNETYRTLLKSLLERLEKGYYFGIISTLTIAECLTKPKKEANLAQVARYTAFFRHFPNLSVIPLSFNIAEKTADLRSRISIRTPDAIQLATAWYEGCDYFITNDKDIRYEGFPFTILQLSKL